MNAAVAAQPTWNVDHRTLATEALDRVLDVPTVSELPLCTQVELRVNASYIANFLALRTGIDATGSLVDSLNFPIFVADLIRGAFDAMVSATIEQTDAYAELLKEVSESVDAYAKELDESCLRELQHAAAEALLTEIYRITRGEHR
jgi:hypothetical protein